MLSVMLSLSRETEPEDQAVRIQVRTGALQVDEGGHARRWRHRLGDVPRTRLEGLRLRPKSGLRAEAHENQRGEQAHGTYSPQKKAF